MSSLREFTMKHRGTKEENRDKLLSHIPTVTVSELHIESTNSKKHLWTSERFRGVTDRRIESRIAEDQAHHASKIISTRHACIPPKKLSAAFRTTSLVTSSKIVCPTLVSRTPALASLTWTPPTTTQLSTAARSMTVQQRLAGDERQLKAQVDELTEELKANQHPNRMRLIQEVIPVRFLATSTATVIWDFSRRLPNEGMARGHEVLPSVSRLSSIPPSKSGKPSSLHESEIMSTLSWDAVVSDNLSIFSEEDWENRESVLNQRHPRLRVGSGPQAPSNGSK
ncbi:hypothetical protein BJ322DRAFT_1217693 [Thelephora terrestris]|uniref:Uncharacterized protein n=1 Tax=Thelephora terrestris TaxID=56493 RepID=A0A9P6HKP5_9AGAM|nr:hypothetical protein BJ322DRAFT_1217693 [Thelephora terrestris]